MEKQELEKRVKEVFEIYPDTEVLVATTDGQVFLPKAESFAHTHAAKIGTKVVTYNRSEFFASSELAKTADTSEGNQEPDSGKTTDENNDVTKDEPPIVPEGLEDNKDDDGKTEDDSSKNLELPDFDAMKKAEIVAWAGERGLALSERTGKDALIQAIEDFLSQEEGEEKEENSSDEEE